MAELNPGFWVYKTNLTLLSGPFTTLTEVLSYLYPNRMEELVDKNARKNLLEMFRVRINKSKPIESELGQVHICRNPSWNRRGSYTTVTHKTPFNSLFLLPLFAIE